jgi:hypothetical protein
VTLTPAQQRVLELYMNGHTSTQIGRALGFTRQRADEVIEVLQRKVLTTVPSELAHTRESHPPDSRTNPWPPAARRAVQGVFVLRSAVLLREDGLELPDGGIPDERGVVWSVSAWPRLTAWSWVASRTRPWSVRDTQQIYTDWGLWLDVCKKPFGQHILPALGSEPHYDLDELTRTLAWVIGVEGLIYP